MPQPTLTKGRSLAVHARTLRSTTDTSSHSLVGTGHVDKAAIFNAEGNSVWASSAGFNVTPAEMQEVVGAYKDTSQPKKVQATGLHIAGQKYIVIKADETSLYGKKVGPTHPRRIDARCRREAEAHTVVGAVC